MLRVPIANESDLSQQAQASNKVRIGPPQRRACGTEHSKCNAHNNQKKKWQQLVV